MCGHDCCASVKFKEEITMVNKLLECVPNYSEGRDMDKIEKILDNFRGKQDVKLLDYQMDPSHNRLVVTVIGEPVALKDAVGSCVLKPI